MRKLKIFLEEKTKERLEFNKKLLSNHISNIVDHSEIISNIIDVKNSSFKMHQVIKKKFDVITEADVVLVTVNKKGKPVRIPNLLKKLIY